MTLNRRTLLAGAIATAAVPLLAACGGGDDDDTPTLKNLVETAQADAQFSTLVSAVVKAELADALSGTDLLTVFAPTNDAFDSAAEALGLADGPALVAALPADALASVLLYHVVAGKNLSTALSAGDLPTLYTFETAPAALGLALTSGVQLTDAVLTQATVTTADIEASNGVIHVIDKVLVPPGVLNIVQMAQLNSNFSTLVAAVSATSDLGDVLSGTDKYTVFAPVNDAFAALPEGTLTTLLETPDGKLRDILLFHVVPGDVRAATVIALEKPATVATALTDESITITNELKIRETFLDGSASLVATDVVASNGVIHVIDRVLNPDYVEPV